MATGWRDRHERFEAALGPSWRSTILGAVAIILGLVLSAVGAVLVSFETTRTIGVAISGHGLPLIGIGILAIWMREERASDQTHDQEMARIQALEAELARLKPPAAPGADVA
jgi:hypothetical protein